MKKQLLSFAGLLALFAVSQVFISGTGKESDNRTSDSTMFRVWAPTIPEHLAFAGEKLPLGDFEVKERLDKEIMVNTFWQSQTFLILKKTNRYFPQLATAESTFTSSTGMGA